MLVFSSSICSLTGSDDFRMTMTDMRDVVVSVEITPALIVVEILHRAAHDVQRLLIRDAQIPPEQSLLALPISDSIRVFIRVNPWQILLDRSLADPQVLILRLLSLLIRGQTNTHRQSQKHQRPQRFELLIEQCKLARVALR